MVDSCFSLDRFVPEGISQASRRSEVGNTKRRSLNTRHGRMGLRTPVDALDEKRNYSMRFQFVGQPDIYNGSVRWVIASAVLRNRSTQPRIIYAKVLI